MPSPTDLKKHALRFILRLVPSYLIVLIGFSVGGSYFIRCLLPVFKHEIQLLHPEYEFQSIQLTTDGNSPQIKYKVDIYRRSNHRLPNHSGGATMRWGFFAHILYIQPTVFLTLFLAWPIVSARTRLKAAAIGFPLLFFMMLIDIPFHIILNIGQAVTIDSLSKRLLAFWVEGFMGNGGRQFMALVVFIISLLPFYVVNPIFDSSESNRNSPCPCGSGKKYKKCCGEG